MPSDVDAILPAELETAAADDVTPSAARSRDPMGPPPERIGHYVLLDKLGAGAMGVVHAAYDTKLDRKVAIKLLLAHGSEPARRRLMREAQALAKLSHPNVVQVYEVGEHGQGPLAQAYIVMEFVDGTTLREWFTAQDHGRAKILEILRAAGRGLAAAHAEGLIHRDFKPDNVMIRRDARVLVMDFGLARGRHDDAAEDGAGEAIARLDGSVLESQSELRHDLTATGAIMGTPAYMAPEQFFGLEADARADQFAFCVTLWEALYRQRPFAGPSLAELSRSVTTGEISTPPRGDVPGWIEAILVRGLAVAPDDRWPSMQALLDALQRDPTRRRRALLGAAVGVGLVVAAVIGVQIQQTRARSAALAACEAEGRTITRDWDERRAALARSFEDSGLQVASAAFEHAATTMDAYAEQWTTLRTRACVETRVEGTRTEASYAQVAGCLDERRETFAGITDAWTQADRDTVVRASVAAAELPPLGPCSDEVALARRKLAPPEHADAVRSLRGRLERVAGLRLAGRYADAREQADAVQAEADALGWRPITAEVALERGRVLELLGKYEDARAAYEQAASDAIAGGHDVVAFDAASALVQLVGWSLSRHEQGRRWQRLATSLLTRLELEGSMREADLLGTTSKLLFGLGTPDLAVDDLRRALEIHERALGPEHLLVAGVLNNIGNVEWERGRYDEALAAHRRALAIREAALGEDHPMVSNSLNNLGLVLWDRGELDAALAAHRRALEIRERTLSPGSISIGTSHNNLALVLWTKGELRPALDSLAQAAEIWSAELGPEHTDVAMVDNNIGLVLKDLGELDDALEHLRRGLAKREAALPAAHPDIATSHDNIGLVLLMQGQTPEALAAFERALAIQEVALAPSHPDYAATLANLGAALAQLGQLDRARELQTRALELREAALGPTHVDVAISLLTLAELDLDTGELDQARARTEQALEIATTVGWVPERLASGRFLLGRIQWALGEHTEARASVREAVRALDEAGADGPAVTSMRTWLREH